MNYLLVLDFKYIPLESQANAFLLLFYNVSLSLDFFSLGPLLSLDLTFFCI